MYDYTCTMLKVQLSLIPWLVFLGSYKTVITGHGVHIHATCSLHVHFPRGMLI